MTDANAPTAHPDTTAGTTTANAGRNPRGGDAPNGRGRPRLFAVWIVLVLVIIAAVFGGYWLNQRIAHDLSAVRQQQARDDSAQMATQVKSDQALSVSRDVDNRMATLASKVADLQSRQQTLQQLYQDLARNRDDWVMNDAQQTLSTANQQLQLTGNIQMALYALQSADAQLATTDAPQVLDIRRAVAADIEKLKAAPVVDLPGLALRLDQAIAQIDTLPLAGDVPAPAAAPLPAPQAPRQSIWTAGYWKALWARITEHVGDSTSRLIQVRRIDRGSADAMLVAPAQAEYLRENVKLRLLAARLSLLSRNEATLQADLNAADDALARYFDPSAAATGRVRTTIAEIRTAAHEVAIPTLDASLQALRQYKSRG